jgi:hypothetical protein
MPIYLFIYIIQRCYNAKYVFIQNTSSECGHSAATCPGLSQSSQNINVVLVREFIPTSSLSILQLKISWPGRSHISHTWLLSELSVLLDTLLSRFRPSSRSRLLFDIFFCHDNFSFNRSISCSSSSFDYSSVLSTKEFPDLPLYRSDSLAQ